jgi:hypothetical protein
MEDQREEGKELLFVGIRVEHERAQGDEAANATARVPTSLARGLTILRKY